MLALTLAGCKTDLYTGLSEREANEMVALLLARGVGADRVRVKDGSSSIQVDRERFAQAVEILKAGGYPRQSFTNMGEIFKGGGLIASPTEERARYVYALSEELSKTISGIDGALSARVHVVLPKNDLLRQDATPSSASVFIRHDKDVPLKELLPQIKLLVANSIEGLSYDKITVVFVPVDRGEVNAALAAAIGLQGEPVGRPLDAVVVPALAGLAAGGALVGGAFWLMRRRREPPDRVVYGVLEPIDAGPSPADALPPVAKRAA